MVATQISLKIKTFRSDGEGEFTSNEFKSYLANHGISHQISCPHTPQQNGVVERKHRHIIETVISLLSQSSLDYSFWSFAAQTVVTLINLLPTSVLYWKFPWFTHYSSFLDLTHLKIFGCAYYPNLRPCTAHKLELGLGSVSSLAILLNLRVTFVLIFTQTVFTLLDMWHLMNPSSLLHYLFNLCPPILILPLFLLGCPINCTSTLPINPHY